MGKDWKTIPGFSKYEISNEGTVRIKKNGYLLVLSVNNKLGYVQVTLTGDDKKKHTLKPHRIVGETFLQKINGKDELNHIDGNKLNNAASNLEWCTGSENKKHAYENNLRKRKHKGIHTMIANNEKRVSVFEKTNGNLHVFSSQKEAAEYFGKGRSWISDIIIRFDGETKYFVVTRLGDENVKEADLIN